MTRARHAWPTPTGLPGTPMSEIKAICPKCGRDVPTGIIMREGGALMMTGASIPCPHCGTRVDISGRYGEARGFLGRLLSENPTREEALAFFQALQSSRAQNGPRDAARAIAEAVPRLEPLLDEYSSWSPKEWQSFLVALIAMFASFAATLEDPKTSGVIQTVGLGAVTVGVMDHNNRQVRNRKKRERRKQRGRK